MIAASVYCHHQLTMGVLAGGGCIGMIDVGDVASAHVSAICNPAAFGRYIVSSDQGISHLEVATYLASDAKLATLPIAKHAESPTTYSPLFNTAKAQRDLGLQRRLISESVVEAAHALLDKGLIHPPGTAAAPQVSAATA